MSALGPTQPTPPLHPARSAFQPAARRGPYNTVGLIGMLCSVLAALLSPLMAFSGAFIVVYFVLGLVALAFAGIVASSIGCFFRPRIFGFIGVAAALLCLGFWILFWAVVTVRLSSAAGKWGLDIGQHAQTSMSAVTLFGAAEAARGPAGEPPATFDFSQVPAQLRTDPWGRSYRYVLVPGSARGYSFVSDGPDGVPGTPDDLDLLAIHPTDGTFGLPPIRRATAGSAGPP